MAKNERELMMDTLREIIHVGDKYDDDVSADEYVGEMVGIAERALRKLKTLQDFYDELDKL